MLYDGEVGYFSGIVRLGVLPDGMADIAGQPDGYIATSAQPDGAMSASHLTMTGDQSSPVL